MLLNIIAALIFMVGIAFIITFAGSYFMNPTKKFSWRFFGLLAGGLSAIRVNYLLEDDGRSGAFSTLAGLLVGITVLICIRAISLSKVKPEAQ